MARDPRAEFLARVRASREAGDNAGDNAGDPAGEASKPHPAGPAPAAAAASTRELVETFAREAREAGASVTVVRSLAECRARVLGILQELFPEPPTRLLRGNTELLEALALDEGLSARGLDVLRCDLRLPGATPEALRTAACEAAAGLTEADYAIAETGTLVFWHRPGQGRALSLLPPVHLAVLRARDIAPDLSLFFARVEEEGRALASALTFVTGPSRTADIEMVITRGVHGPGDLAIVVLCEETLREEEKDHA